MDFVKEDFDTEALMLDFSPINKELVLWAGFPKPKGQLEEFFSQALTSRQSQVILNWGERGSGKTHAATYFLAPDVLTRLTSPAVKNIHPFYIRMPTELEKSEEPTKAEWRFYESTIEAIGFKRIRTVMSDLIVSHGEKFVATRMQELVGSETLGKALCLLGQEKSKSGKLSLFQEDKGSEKWHLLLRRLFFSRTTKRDLRRLGLSRGIISAQERFKVLRGILQCLIGLDSSDAIANNNRIILWLDEIENLTDYLSDYYFPFIGYLADLIDHLPHYFTLLINYSVSLPTFLKEFKETLGEALFERVTHTVYFEEANEEEAREYVRELLAFYRSDSWEEGKLPDVYPFTEEALHTLISGVRLRTPGNLNRQLSDVISQATPRGVISSPGEGIIDKQFILTLQKEYHEMEMRYGYALR